MGAHPSAPSGVARDSATLDAVIAADPDRELGPQCAATFGGRLPFLLKVLSADKALSIQVHPTRAQAEAGYQAENRRGLAPGDPARNYVDDWPKPELLYALTPFEVVAGLRPPADAAAILRALAVEQLAPLASRLAAATGSVGSSALASALASVLEWADPAGLVDAVVAACARVAVAGGPYADACAAAVRVAADHPGDLGRGRAAADAARGAPAGPGGVHAGRRPARLPAGHRHRAARQLRQRGPRRPHRQAHRRARAAGAPRPFGLGAGRSRPACWPTG